MKNESLLSFLVRINTDRERLITAFQDGSNIQLWTEYPFNVGRTVHLMDKNLGMNEKAGKVWRINRFSLTGFSADRITWEEKEQHWHERPGKKHPYKSPEISWKGGVLNLEEVSELLNNSCYKQLQHADFDRFFRKYIFGLVLQSQGQEELNVKSYLWDFLKFD